MQLRPAIALQAIIKSFVDNVMPAVDPTNKLAQEQAQLMVGLLTLMAERLPLEYRYDLAELRRCVALGERLAELVGVDGREGVARAAAHGADVVRRAGAEPGELQAAVGGLRASIGDLVEYCFRTKDAVVRRELTAAMLAAGREQQLYERSWLKMQGWEADPASVPAIETLLPEPMAGAR